MKFNNDILAGTTLARDDIRSEDFIAGTSGWIIERDGDAEFNDVIARGRIEASFITVDNPTFLGRIDIDPATWFDDGVTTIRFISENPDERNPALLQTDYNTISQRPSVRLAPAEGLPDNGVPAFTILNESDDETQGPFFLFLSPIGASIPTVMRIGSFGNPISIVAPAMRTIKTRNDNNIVFGSFGNTNFNALGEGHSFVGPESGIVKITLVHRMSQAGANSAQRLYLGYEVRTGSTVGSGSLVSNSADTNHSVNHSHQGGRETLFETQTYTDTIEGLTTHEDYNIELFLRVTNSASVSKSLFRTVMTEPSF